MKELGEGVASPLAIAIYKDLRTTSPTSDYDCGIATENMALAASSLDHGVKIIGSPLPVLNGEDHDRICEKLDVDAAMEAEAVLLIGKTETLLFTAYMCGS